MTSRSHAPRRGLAPVLLLLAAIACGDAETPATPGDARATIAARPGALRNPDIDRTDTYFAFYLTTTEESGGMSVQSEASSETRYYETGFEPDGDLLLDVYRQPSTDPAIPDPPALIRTIENMVYFYARDGSLMHAGRFDDLMAASGLPGGDLANATTEGSVYYGGGGGAAPKEPIYMESFPAGDGMPETRRVSDDVVEVVVRTPGGTRPRAAGGARTETIRRYRKRAAAEGGEAASQGHRWLLDEVEQTAWLPGRGGGERQIHTRSRYRYVAYHINPGRDRERRMRLDAQAAAAPARGAPPASTAAADGQVGAASVDGINYCERGDTHDVRVVEPGGASIVWQHGFCDHAESWRAMRPKVAESHYVGLSQAYSLNSDAHLRTQVADLAGRLYAQSARGTVVVAHSQGGLVARRLGQRYPEVVGSVITIGTPHQGARIATAGPAALSDALFGVLPDVCFGNVLCPLQEALVQSIGSGFLTWGTGQLIPAAGDDRPGSAFIDSVNATWEPFRRASIEVSVPLRWSIFRLLGDKESPRDLLLTESPLKGRTYAKRAQDAYWAGWVLRDVAAALRWRAYDYGRGWGCHQSGYQRDWEPCYNPWGYADHWYMSGYWLTIASATDWVGRQITDWLDAIDREWNFDTAGNEKKSDGFIQFSSQVYPNSPGAFPPLHYAVPNSDESHSGETASVRVMQALRVALTESGYPRN